MLTTPGGREVRGVAGQKKSVEISDWREKIGDRESVVEKS